MPICFCTSHGCCAFGDINPATGKPSGRSLTSQTLKKHSLDDQVASVNLDRAQYRAQQVLDTQIAEISAHLAASTLSDEVSGPSKVPGGRMWGSDITHMEHSQHSTSVESQHPEDPLSTSSTRSSPKPLTSNVRKSRPPGQGIPARVPEREVLSCLKDIDTSVESFLREAASNLDSLTLPSKAAPTVSPLQSLVDKSSYLRDRLDAVSWKSQTVRETKESISKKLRDVDQRLESAQSAWSARLSRIKETKTPSHGLPFDTSTSHVCLTTYLKTEGSFRSPL